MLAPLGNVTTTGPMIDEAAALSFYETVSEQLEQCARHFKAGRREEAADCLENAVTLCESNPAYAPCHVIAFGASLHQVVHGIVSNAVVKGRSGERMIRIARENRSREAIRHPLSCTYVARASFT